MNPEKCSFRFYLTPALTFLCFFTVDSVALCKESVTFVLEATSLARVNLEQKPVAVFKRIVASTIPRSILMKSFIDSLLEPCVCTTVRLVVKKLNPFQIRASISLFPYKPCSIYMESCKRRRLKLLLLLLFFCFVFCFFSMVSLACVQTSPVSCTQARVSFGRSERLSS